MVYDIFRVIGIITGYPFKWLFFKTKVYYEDKTVQSRRIRGGALIISNHFNILDYIVTVFIVFPRKLYVVASEMAYRNKIMHFLMKFWGGIQVNRVTKSMRFIIDSVKEIRKGNIVQIFPEGHNTDDGTIKSFYPSYVAIALKAKSPIIPIITDGNYGIFKRTHVIIGKPINVYDYLSNEKYTYDDIYRINDIIHQQVLDLRKELDIKIQNSKKAQQKGN